MRENLRLLKSGGKTFSETVNISINQTLARSINTTVTTALVLVSVYIIGVPSIKAFVLPIIVGILAGAFSSICLAGPMWDLFRNAKDGTKAKAKPE